MLRNLLCLSALLISPVLAEEFVFPDAAAAMAKDPDFSVQGEYAGELDGKKVGVQLIAEGDRKFSAVLYPPGSRARRPAAR